VCSFSNITSHQNRFVAVREAFSTAYPDKEVLNKTTMHRPVTYFRDTGSVCDVKYVRRQTVLTGETLRFISNVSERSHYFYRWCLFRVLVKEFP
jgi:hypothetical protein